MLSGERLRIFSQNVLRSLPSLLRDASTIDHISLQRTSVATYGYLKRGLVYVYMFIVQTNLCLPLSGGSISPETKPKSRVRTS
jgi:hypothetical protein